MAGHQKLSVAEKEATLTGETKMGALANFEVDGTMTWDGIHDAVRALGLERNVADLERNGITTITPAQSGITPEIVEVVREELLKLSGEITDRKFSLEQGPDKPISELEPNNIFLIFQLLAYRVPQFEKLMLNPALQALMGYLLGPARRLSSLSGFVKWQSSKSPEGNRFEPMGLHADSPSDHAIPTSPLLVANSNFLLTDFGCWEDGPMVVAPGSHREGRHPLEGDASRMEGYYAPAGSIVVFGGALQHGSLARESPGMRVSINAFFCQPYVAPQEFLQDQFAEVAARGKLASQLVWQDARTGWGIQGPAYMRTPFNKATQRDDGYGLIPKNRHPNSQL